MRVQLDAVYSAVMNDVATRTHPATVIINVSLLQMYYVARYFITISALADHIMRVKYVSEMESKG